MKKLFFLALSFLTMSLYAVNYCATSSWGYAGNVTGGGNATPTLVSNESQLSTALSRAGSVIIITSDITISNQLSSSKDNLTIMALPGVKLISTQQSKEVSGILSFSGSNIILRNITFEGPGAYDCDGKDLLLLSGARKVWVDHCDFQDGCDGNFDINSKSDNITVTWCRFRYLKEPRAGGSGGAADHRFSNLVGSGSNDKPTDGTYNITYGFCWWDEGCKERMTRCRNCNLHFLNCYWNSSVANYYIGPENAACYFEGCRFEGNPSKAKIFYQNYGGTNGSMFVNCSATKGVPDNVTDREVLTPSYTYDQLTAAEAKSYVTNATCGAGATLTVTNTAEVSSSCDSDVPPVDPPTPIVVDGDCCVDLSLGAAPTVSNEGIPADYSLLVVTPTFTTSVWVQNYVQLNTNKDYITFDFSAYLTTIEAVEFDVTIPNWSDTKNTIAYHWNNEDNSTAIINSSDKQMIQLAAPENAKSFTIQRSAGTGTRIAGICFQLADADPTGIEETGTKNAAHKVLRNGQISIVRGGQRYTIFGQRL